MKKISARFLILISLLNKVTLFQKHRIMKVTERKTWFEAQNHCREHNSSLYSGSLMKYEQWEYTGAPKPDCWIGLYRDANKTLKWSEGILASGFRSSFRHYNGTGNTSCVARIKNEWHEIPCYEKLQFYCFETDMVLVKQNKTWEEAHEHCRSEDKDLASPVRAADLNIALWICGESQTEYVWIGLRYLARRWLTIQNDSNHDTRGIRKMPECPAWGHYCGAISTTEHTWVNWDCAAKLNFIC